MNRHLIYIFLVAFSMTQASAIEDSDFYYNEALKYEFGYDNYDQNFDLALKYYTLSANEGDKHAQNRLGEIYENGIGVPTNINKAIEWYQLSANQKWSVEAKYNIGRLYEQGIGFPQNYKEAIKWYKASNSDMFGYSKARYRLGVMAEEGLGMSKDNQQALTMYRIAAEDYDDLASYKLGYFYENGIAVRQNISLAKEWYGKACDLGLQLGCDEYKRLNSIYS